VNNIDFLIVNYNTCGFINLLLKSISKFSSGYSFFIYIVDNSNNYKIENITLKNIFVIPNNVIYGSASLAHAEGINMAFQKGLSKYVCVLDPDTVFINDWINYCIDSLEQYSFISSRFETKLNIARPQFMFFKRCFLENNKLKFSYWKDTGGNLTKYCVDNRLKYLILNNSYNDKSLVKNHMFPKLYCEQAFIDSKPFFLHQGRGASKGDRSCWFRTLEGRYE